MLQPQAPARPAPPRPRSPARLLRIATRASPMALAQVDRVRGALLAAFPELAVEVVALSTSGDRHPGPLSQLGGKGAFTKEVDAALLDGRADLAVHCMKDVPGDRPLPPGTSLAGYLPRDDLHDALIHPGGLSLAQLPAGTRIGTSSVRRAAQLARHHPHLAAVAIRGNANSRLAKLAAGEVDALLLALSGLERIGRADAVTQVLDLETMCPPLGAGVLGLQIRADDPHAAACAARLADPDTARQMLAERTLLHVLKGHCNSPIAGWAHTGPDGRLCLRARVFTPDGATVLGAHAWGEEAEVLGATVALDLLRQGARRLIDAIPH